MSDVKATVFAEPLHIVVDFDETVRAEAVAWKTLVFDYAEGKPPWRQQVSGWDIQPAKGATTQFVITAPAGTTPRPKPHTHASLTYKLGTAKQEDISCLVIGERSGHESVIAEIRDARKAASLYSAYPILTSPGPDGAGGGGGAAAPAAAGASAKAAVQREWRAVLGRVPSDGDVTGMLAALDRRFVASEEDGVEAWVWTPGSYVGQNDIGAGITGAQASLAAFAQRVAEEIEPLAAELSPLCRRDDNPEELDIARRGFKDSWCSFVKSLGAEGGLPTARCTVLLEQARSQLIRFGIELGMLDDDQSAAATTQAARVPPKQPAPSEEPFEKLGKRDVLRSFVLTREDEEQRTNFTIVRDRVAAVGRAFVAARETAKRDYGTEFTMLQRDLDVLPELVADVRWALDSVELGVEQQEAMELGKDGTTLAVVLQWAEDLADEGRALLQDAGVRGARLLAGRAEALGKQLDIVKAQMRRRKGGDFRDDRLTLPRVHKPIEHLGSAVGRVVTQAGDIAEQAGKP
jgi:hypothetical protein